jgi:hypothetical protein
VQDQLLGHEEAVEIERLVRQRNEHDHEHPELHSAQREPFTPSGRGQ